MRITTNKTIGMTIITTILFFLLIHYTTATLSYTGATYIPKCSPGTQTIKDFTINSERNHLYMALSDGTLEIDDISNGGQTNLICDVATTGVKNINTLEYNDNTLWTDSRIYNITYVSNIPLLTDKGASPIVNTTSTGAGTWMDNQLTFTDHNHAYSIIHIAETAGAGCSGGGTRYRTKMQTYLINGDSYSIVTTTPGGATASNLFDTCDYAYSSGPSDGTTLTGAMMTTDGKILASQYNAGAGFSRGYYNSPNTIRSNKTTSNDNYDVLNPSNKTTTGYTANLPTGIQVNLPGLSTARFSQTLGYDATTKYAYAPGSNGGIQGATLIDYSNDNIPTARGICGKTSTMYTSIYHISNSEVYLFYPIIGGESSAIRCDYTNPVNPSGYNETAITNKIYHYKTFTGNYSNQLYVLEGNNTAEKNVRIITGFTGSTSTTCGNGILEFAETCDNGIANGACPLTCSNTCQVNTCTTNTTTTTLTKTGQANFGKNYTLSDISFDGVLSFITAHYADNSQSINYLETIDYTSGAFQTGQPITSTFHSERIINSNTNYTDGNTYADNYVWTGSDNNFFRFVNTQNYNTIQIAGYDNYNNGTYIAKDIQKITNTTYLACWWNPSTGGGIISTINVNQPSSYGGAFQDLNSTPYSGSTTYDYCRQIIYDPTNKMAYLLTRNYLYYYNLSTNTPVFTTLYPLPQASSTSHQAMTLDNANGYIYIAEPANGIERVSKYAPASLGTCNPAPASLFNFDTGDFLTGAQSVDIGTNNDIYITTNAQLANDNTNAGVRTLFSACNASNSWIGGINAYTNYGETRQGLGTSDIIKSEVMRYDNLTDQFHIIDQNGNYATYKIVTGVTNTNITGAYNGTLAITLQDDITLAPIDYATLSLTVNNAGNTNPITWSATGAPNPITHVTTFTNVPIGYFLTLTVHATNTTGSPYNVLTDPTIYLPTTNLVQQTRLMHMPIPGSTANSTGELHLTFLDDQNNQPILGVVVSLSGFVTYETYDAISDTTGTINIVNIIPDTYLATIIPPSPFVAYAISPTIHAGEIVNYTVNLSRDTFQGNTNSTNSPQTSYTTRGCTDFIKNTWLCGQSNTTCNANTDCLGGMCIKYISGGTCTSFNYNLCDKDKIQRGYRCMITETFKGGMAGIGNHLLKYFFFYALIIGITMFLIIVFRKKT